jgi:hypothetical protein
MKAALHINSESGIWKTFCVLRTILLVTLGRYFIRGDSFLDALRMIRRLFVNPAPFELLNGSILQSGLLTADHIILALSIAILFIVDAVQEKGYSIREALGKQSFLVQFSILFTGLVILVYFGIYAQGHIPAEFIYQNI